jgi:hypothetical protein
MQKYFFSAFILLLLGCNSTQQNSEKPALDRQVFEETLLDLHLAESIKNTDAVYSFKHFTASEKKSLLSSVFNKHHTDSAAFFQTMKYYQEKSPKEYEQILNDLVLQVDSLINIHKTQKPNPVQPPTDSAKIRETISRLFNR